VAVEAGVGARGCRWVWVEAAWAVWVVRVWEAEVARAPAACCSSQRAREPPGATAADRTASRLETAALRLEPSRHLAGGRREIQSWSERRQWIVVRWIYLYTAEEKSTIQTVPQERAVEAAGILPSPSSSG
jgi:hypothetical protein